MYIQSCADPKTQFARPVFKKQKRHEDYYSYMSRNSDDIVKISVIVGSATGAFAARKNFNEELIPKTFRNIGATTLGLFGLVSANFMIPEAKDTAKLPNA